jgi:hypothetical protein
MLVLLACGLAANSARADAPGLQLVYQATFPNGWPQASVDHLRIGPLLLGDSQIANSSPTFQRLPGELYMSITRPVGLSGLVVSAGAFATRLNFGPGSISRASATFRAPVGPLTTGGWAVGLSARTGNENDLNSETRVSTTLNVRPGGVVRLNVPFGSTAPTFVVLPTAVRDQIFGAVPKSFTLELTVDRMNGMGSAVLSVGNAVIPLSFTLSEFLANGGPAITAMGPSIANASAAGQTVSVHLRDFRIYTKLR